MHNQKFTFWDVTKIGNSFLCFCQLAFANCLIQSLLKRERACHCLPRVLVGAVILILKCNSNVFVRVFLSVKPVDSLC